MIPIFELVKADLDQRDEFGFRKYGKSLFPFDGRRTLQDAYEEALDLAVYLKKEIVERGLPVLSAETLARLAEADMTGWIPSLRRDLAALASELGLPQTATEEEIEVAAIAAQKEKEK